MKGLFNELTKMIMKTFNENLLNFVRLRYTSMAFKRDQSAPVSQADVIRCEGSVPAALTTELRRLQLALQHGVARSGSPGVQARSGSRGSRSRSPQGGRVGLSPRAIQSTQLKIRELEKRIYAGKQDCLRKASSSRRIHEAQTIAAQREAQAQAKQVKYQTQGAKAEMRAAKKLQSIQVAQARKEAGLKSPAEKAAIGLGVVGALGAAAYFLMGG